MATRGTRQETEHKGFREPDETREFPNGRVEILRVGDGEVGRFVFEPGWRWSNDVKPIANTHSCEAPHFQYHVSGQLAIRMDDGTEFVAGPGEITSLPSGHDAWVVGDEPAVVIDWYGASNYAKRSNRKPKPAVGGRSEALPPRKEIEMARLEGKSFDSPDETRTPEKAKIDSVTIGGLTFARETLEPGWRWSSHVKPTVGGESCQRRHVKIFISGRQRIRMGDGTEMEFGPGDVAIIDPGHDGWVVGDEPNLLFELAEATMEE